MIRGGGNYLLVTITGVRMLMHCSGRGAEQNSSLTLCPPVTRSDPGQRPCGDAAVLQPSRPIRAANDMWHFLLRIGGQHYYSVN